MLKIYLQSYSFLLYLISIYIMEIIIIVDWPSLSFLINVKPCQREWPCDTYYDNSNDNNSSKNDNKNDKNTGQEQVTSL